MSKRSFRLIFLGILFFVQGNVFAQPVCLYVSSYHQGYHWNDGIESGLQKSLGDACVLERFYMDTKRNKGAEFAEQKAAEAKRLIDNTRPDVVIACDDNASRYLVVPHLANTDTQVVFCGVNWTVEAYGYPYPNVTGMIEVAPIKALMQHARRIKPSATKFAFVSADVPTQHKDVERLTRFSREENVAFSHWLVGSYSEWQKAYIQAQLENDVVILGNPAGINDWSHDQAALFIRDNTSRLTVSFGLAMSRHAIFSMVNMPEEQGEWSGELARLILKGHSPADLAITSNRRWKVIANPRLARKIAIELPEFILQGAEILDSNQ